MASLLQKALLTLNLMDAEHYCRGLCGFKRSQSRSRERLRDVPDSTRPPPHAFSSVPQALQIALTHAASPIASFRLDSRWVKSQNESDRDAIPKRPVLHPNLVSGTPSSVPCRRFDACRAKGVPSMCDYSLDLVASRPAKVGDELVTRMFENSMTRGFAAIGEPNVAVCLLPGTEVAFEQEVSYERFFAFLPHIKLGTKVARFRQINVGKPRVHHDALEFPD